MNIIIAIILASSGMSVYFINRHLLSKYEKSKQYLRKIILLIIILNCLWITININNIEIIKFTIGFQLFSWVKFSDWNDKDERTNIKNSINKGENEKWRKQVQNKKS